MLDILLDEAENKSVDIIIYDGRGYYCRTRRIQSTVYTLWSPHRRDAFRFHFIEVARKTAATIPQRVTLLPALHTGRQLRIQK